MRWRALLLVSIGLNLGLAMALYIFPMRTPSPHLEFTPVATAAAATNQFRTILRKQLFSWHEVESPDYPTYIANLRDIGCPDSTIRDIIVADVNQLYALKRSTEIVTTEQQWWRSEPDAALLKSAEEKLLSLDVERRALLARLLGSNWEVTEPSFAALRQLPAIALDGPVLGVLPADVKRGVREIAVRQRQKAQDYVETERAAGRNPDASVLAQIRQDSRNELSKILSPIQLEEFLLRYSENAQVLRKELGQLKNFNATPDEFRNIFRALEQNDQPVQPGTLASDLNAQQRELAIKAALGEKRYAVYRLLHDPLYQAAYEAASASGSVQTVGTLYAILQATADERSRIEADASLTPQQRDIELKKIELEQARANATALGQIVPTTAQPPPSLPPPPSRIVHVMQPGETLGALSSRYGIPVRDILSANENRNLPALKPGDSIYVPTLSGLKTP